MYFTYFSKQFAISSVDIEKSGKTNLSNLFMLQTWFLSPFYCWRKDKLDRKKFERKIRWKKFVHLIVQTALQQQKQFIFFHFAAPFDFNERSETHWLPRKVKINFLTIFELYLHKDIKSSMKLPWWTGVTEGLHLREVIFENCDIY